MSSPLETFIVEIACEVIAPKVIHVFNVEHPQSEAELHKQFCSYFECNVSLKTFKKWLDYADISFYRKLHINTPDTPQLAAIKKVLP
jgi:hypothetical protein